MTTLEKPALKMVTLSINGQSLSVPAGFTILKAARSAGVYIPTLCDHPSLEPFGGCRLCIVEVKGMRGLPTACSTPVNEGMEVATDTVQLRELRKNILELILCEHPHACLTCERKERCGPFDVCLRNVAVNERCVLCVKNQNCELQRVADYIGVKGWQVSLPYNYRNLGILRDSPFFDRDYNLCILCGRCVRVCQDVRGASAIAFTYRGSQALVGTAFGKDLKDSGCVFCMACVEVCPTGALVDRDAWQTKGIKCEDLIVPCSHACPAHIDIPRYVYLAADKRYTEALSVIREKVPFPGSLGRVCIHPCEEACRRGALNQPVSIKELKRAAADLGGPLPGWRRSQGKRSPLSVRDLPGSQRRFI
jgi:predicted molibdopterin-dependent oxidoreductase YjgC